MDSALTPFHIGSSESSGNVSDNSSYSEKFIGEPAEYDPQVIIYHPMLRLDSLISNFRLLVCSNNYIFFDPTTR